MDTKEIILTREGREKLEQELEERTGARREEIIERLKEARGFGDLSENAEYDAAKDEQANNEARIREIRNILKNAKVVESVARIDEEGVLKADNVALATANVKEKERLSEEAKTHFAQASKERMKISEHREIWLREELKEEEHRQEIELEDFTGKKNVESLEGDGD